MADTMWRQYMFYICALCVLRLSPVSTCSSLWGVKRGTSTPSTSSLWPSPSSPSAEDPSQSPPMWNHWRVSALASPSTLPSGTQMWVEGSAEWLVNKFKSSSLFCCIEMGSSRRSPKHLKYIKKQIHISIYKGPSKQQSDMLKCQSPVPAVSKWTPLFEAPRSHGSGLLHRALALAAHSGTLTALSAVWELGDVWRLLHWPPCPGTKPKGTRTTQQFSFHYLLGQLRETSLMGSGLHVLAEESESSTCSPFFTELFVESNFIATLTSTVFLTPLSFPLTK